MCGIAGFVDFEDNNINRENTLHNMTQKIGCGYDNETLYIEKNIALGMLNSKQTNPINESKLKNIVFSGILYNEKELQTQIHNFYPYEVKLSTCEIVFKAYQLWGIECFKRFDGAYAVAIWDDCLKQLILARDSIGIKPLYYYNTEKTICFGSTPKAILAHPLTCAEIDINGLRDIFSFVKSPGHALFRNMNEVLPGSAIRIKQDSIKVHRYWSLNNIEHRDDLKTTVLSIRDILEDSVTRRLSSASIQLSGGLDSCTILGIASHLNQRDHNDKIRTFAAQWVGQYFPNGTPPDFNNEEKAIIEMVKRENTDHTNVRVDVSKLLDDDIRAATVIARDMPTGLGDMDALYYLFWKGIRESASITLSGEGADELFGGYFWFHDPKYLQTDGFPFLNINNILQTGDSSASLDLMDPILVKQLDMKSYQYDIYKNAISQVPPISSNDKIEKRMREICYLHLTHWMPILLDRRDRISRATGIEVHLPYCDQRLIEYVFNVPWKLKKHDVYSKSLLRKVALKYLPESIVYQGKSMWVANQPLGYELELQKKMNHMLSSNNAPIIGLLDQKQVKKFREDYWANTTLSSHTIGGVLRLNHWLNEYKVKIIGV